MKIDKVNLPPKSILYVDHKKYDYTDSYRSELIDDNQKVCATDVAKAFFSSRPKWVGVLFLFRNKVVSFFGLKTGGIIDRQEQLDNFRCEENERFGLFKVFKKTNDEVILGEDDKHLNFRISLLLAPSKGEPSKKELTISTTVVFNNWFGNLYFFPIRPFHKLIVPIMLKGIIKELEKKDHVN